MAVMPELPVQEELAFTFIQKELKKGRFPSVRAVSRALGYRSSRSGARLIQLLIAKGKLSRSTEGRLVVGS